MDWDADDRVVVVHDRPFRNVTLLCGPPGSGKSTLAVLAHSRVVDMDDLPAGSARDRMREFGRRVWRVGRNPFADVAVVACAPSAARREKLAEQCQASRTVVLLTDRETCRERVIARGRDGVDGRDVDGQLAAVDDWFASYEPA